MSQYTINHVGTRRGLHRPPVRSIKSALAGTLMLIASALPWLRMPFGQLYSAWHLQVDAGWHIQSGSFTYGALCLVCACAAFLSAYFASRPRWNSAIPRGSAMLCLMTVSLFFAQYLLNDLHTIDQLVQQKNQMLLIMGHFGYTHTPELFAFKTGAIDISDLGIRFQLLVDQLQIGVFVMLAGMCLMLDFRKANDAASPGKQPARALFAAGFLLFVLLITGRAFAGMIAQNEAASAISQGDYTAALQWLDRATYFDPALNELPSYHIERGRADYFLYPTRQSDDSRAYVASLLIQQKDDQGAYQLLSTISQGNPWMLDQIRSALESAVEAAHPAQLQYLPQKPQAIVAKDSAALPWLRVLEQTDPGNVYAQYMLGRVDYDLQEYAASKAELLASLGLVSDEAYQSSVYTYVALNDYLMGNYIEGRGMLLKAIQLDPEYRNDIARETVSGL